MVSVGLDSAENKKSQHIPHDTNRITLFATDTQCLIHLVKLLIERLLFVGALVATQIPSAAAIIPPQSVGINRNGNSDVTCRRRSTVIFPRYLAMQTTPACVQKPLSMVFIIFVTARKCNRLRPVI